MDGWVGGGGTTTKKRSFVGVLLVFVLVCSLPAHFFTKIHGIGLISENRTARCELCLIVIAVSQVGGRRTDYHDYMEIPAVTLLAPRPPLADHHHHAA